MIGVARPFQSFNGRRRPRFESKNTAITILPTVRRRVNPCQRGFGYQKRRRLCQRKHGKRRVQKSNSNVYDYVPARSVDDIVEELVTKGRFPIKLKTKIRYLIIGGYHNFMR